MSASDPGFYVCAPVSVVLATDKFSRSQANISLGVTTGRVPPHAVVQDGDRAWWVSVRDCARSTFSILVPRSVGGDGCAAVNAVWSCGVLN